MLPTQLIEEVEELRAEGHAIELTAGDGWANVVFHNYKVPSGFNKRVIDLLLKFPLSYPNGRPDMFWTDQDLLLENHSVPQSADAIETALGRQWRRFSWHPKSWNPGVDNLRSYLEFVNNRLAKAV